MQNRHALGQTQFGTRSKTNRFLSSGPAKAKTDYISTPNSDASRGLFRAKKQAKRISHATVAVIAIAAISGCAGQNYKHLPSQAAAYRIIPPVEDAPPPRHYLIIPGDELTYAVYGEPDMSIDKLVVDDGGFIQVPLAGAIKVGGITTDEARLLIQDKLGSKYIRNPNVSLNITTPVPRLVFVEGEVTQPGSYAITLDSTLLDSLAMAKSPTNKASYDEVVIFRTIGDKRMAARFDITRIRAGLDPDPRVAPGDTIVVGLSHAKSIYRDVLTAAPLFNVFSQFRY